MTKSFADEYGVYTLDELNRNADALAAFDATDPVPGNGVADIFGCAESWTCDNIITSQIAFSGWHNIAQTIAGYDAMFAQAIDADHCPAAAANPDGLCPIGWIAADILVTANTEFLAAHPAAEALFEAVKLSVIEVSLANVAQDEGAGAADLAAGWIADNRTTVDAWLDVARAAA